MARNSHTKRNLAVGGVLLAGLSYAAGILTAPKSGRETRKDIRKAALKAKTEAERKLKAAHSELNDVVDEVSKKATSVKSKANDELQAALKQAKNVRTKASEILSAIHEGDSDDHDLEKALTDVKKALKHLKTFAKK